MTPGTEQQRVLGRRYRLERSIGSGGMGTVWAGRDQLLDRAVAVKEIRFPGELGSTEQDQLRERTLREARATARLSHPNVVTTYDVVEEDGRPWIVMELLPSRSLSTVLREDGALPPHRVAEIGLDVLAALEVSHQHDIVHRDVKPGNVLLTPEGRAVLTDFGIATTSGDPSLTSTGVLLGSPSYMSPERARGQRPGPESDLWGLGATLFAAAEGRPPYDQDNVLSILTAVISDPVPEPNVDGPLRDAITGLLAKDPAERPGIAATRRLLEAAAADRTAATAPVVAPAATQALERAGRTEALPLVADELVPRARPVDTAPSPPRREGRRTPSGLAVMLVILFLLLAGVLAFALLRPGDDPGTGQARDTPSQKASHSTPSQRSSSSSSSSAATSSGAQGNGGGSSNAGTVRYRDTTGYSLRVPKGWAESHPTSTQTRFSDPASPTRYLLIDWTDSPKDDPKADWEEQEKSRSQRLESYHRISIEDVDYKGWPAADWHYTFGTRTEALDRGFVPGAKGYAIYVQGPRDTFADTMKVFDKAAETFEPAR